MNKNKPTYLDYAATTPVDKRVLDEMLTYFMEEYGNAHSRTHEYGWNAEKAVKKAREQVASLIHAVPEEIIFTSGATESINWALKGVFESYAKKGNHIITQKTEHKAVLDTCEYLEAKGAMVTYLDVDSSGLIDLNELQNAITDQTILVAIMYGNNETGVIQPIPEIGKICRNNEVLFFCDATQAVGKVPVDTKKDNIDLLACSAHKMFGPKGIGALYIQRTFPRIKLTPLLHGGGHEKGYRSGTLNIPGIVGFGKAAELAQAEFIENYKKLVLERDLLEQELLTINGAYINGVVAPRLPHIISIGFNGIDGEALIIQIRDNLAVGIGSACSTSTLDASYVLQAMSGDKNKAEESIRISSLIEPKMKWTELQKLKSAINKLRSIS